MLHPVFISMLFISSVVFCIIYGLYIIFTAPRRRARDLAIRHQAQELGFNEGEIFAESEAVKDLILSYLRIIKKHGSTSEEAKAFRFGTDNKSLRKLYKNNKAIESFHRVADLIDKADSE